MEIRSMQPEDVPLAERLSAEAFYELDVRIRRPHETEPEKRPAEQAEKWNRRTQRFLDTDPEGCVVAVDEHGLAGFATSIRRDDAVWALATFAVRPGLQGQGVGKRILSLAAQHGAGCPRWMLSASDDPKAVRRYRLAGFDLHPQMVLSGQVDRSALPTVGGLRQGSLDDVGLLDRIDRLARGAGHGPDHETLASMGTLVVDTAGRGYAYAGTSGRTARRPRRGDRGPAAVGVPGAHHGRAGRRRPCHRRQPVGDGRRARLSLEPRNRRLPGGSRDGSAHDVHPQRGAALTGADHVGARRGRGPSRRRGRGRRR
ncbi:GNAT family N-acetyltransferase [Nocardioides sp. NPDC051685]|uniref:GNAT family N-acetyltransferase n=1 Tax=Nocardioides sp. NPDC051685 TaxID=3364334 RepID=UPI0037B01583